MLVIDNILTSNIDFKETYVAIGNFDGVHIGHKEIIKRMVAEAKIKNKMSVVFTFEKHPVEFFNKNKDKKFNYINTNEEKIYLLESLGVDATILQPFDKNFADYSPLEFVRILKNKLKVKKIFVGFNFSFGKGGVGKVSDLKYLCEIYGIEVEEVSPVKIDGEIVSSSLIRKKILMGEFKNVIKYLDHPLIVIGTVIHGKKLARELGFPTANIKIQNRLYPPFGIYGAYLQIDDKNSPMEYGVVNVGVNPTLKPGELSLEVHILDFNKDIYGEKIYLQLVEYIREEKKFNSIDELKKTVNDNIDYWKKHRRELENGINFKNR